MNNLDLFATCAPGLEPLLQNELQTIGAKRPEAQPGGVRFSGDWAMMARVNLESGLALRVLQRLARFEARHLSQLSKRAEKVPWDSFFSPGSAVKLKVSARKSKLYHTGAIEERVARAILGRLGPPQEDGTSALVQIRVSNDVCEISLDTSGASLHQRGWRQNTAKAPMREDLARALLIASGWRPGVALVDPMAGAGTILIEAAVWAKGALPGSMRTFAFEEALGFEQGDFDALKTDRMASVLPSVPGVFLGGDRDAGALETISQNAARAEVAQALQLQQAAISGFGFKALKDQEEAVLISNPPYGHRIGKPQTLRNLYASIGNKARELRTKLPQGLGIALYATQEKLIHATGLPLKSAFMTDHGGLKIKAFVGRI